MLEPLGARTAVAGDGQTALALFDRQHADVALLDLDLPDQRGLDVARSLRGMRGGADLPLVVLSAHIDADDRMAAQGLGVLACLDKPFDPDALVQLMAHLPRAQTGLAAAGPPPRAKQATDLGALFAGQWPAMEAAITGAVDASALRRAVHALRGSLAFVGDASLRRLARDVETALAAGTDHGQVPLADLLQRCRALAGA